jgi:hypothetical protein
VDASEEGDDVARRLDAELVALELVGERVAGFVSGLIGHVRAPSLLRVVGTMFRA